MTSQAKESIEIGFLERFGGYGYRVDGVQWSDCAKFAGFTPRSDDASDIQNALVAVAHAHGLDVSCDAVTVEGLHACYYVAN